MFGAAAALVLLVTDFQVLAAVIYPAYLFAADAAMVVMIVASPHYKVPLPAASQPRAFHVESAMRLSAASAQWRPVTGRDWRQPDLAGVPQHARARGGYRLGPPRAGAYQLVTSPLWCG